jgi:GT2 family glycosyltransferase
VPFLIGRANNQVRRNREENSRLNKKRKNHSNKGMLTEIDNLGEEMQRVGIAEPKIAIVVLNWNQKRITVECLESVKKINYSNYEILLVDNGSTDGSQECFRVRYPETVLLENEANLGFSEGNNVGIRRAMDWHPDYVLLLNNDTVVDESFLCELVRVAESDSRIGFVGPKIYFEEHRGRDDIVASAGSRINLWIGNARNIGEREKDIGQYDDVRETSFLQGACLLVRSEVVRRIGLLDVTFFAYWEEADWCWRGWCAGYKSVFVPKAKIWHKVAASSSDIRRKNHRMYFITRNRFWFVRKNATRKQYLCSLVYFFLVQFWLSSVRVIGGMTGAHTFFCFLKGIRDGIGTRWD